MELNGIDAVAEPAGHWSLPMATAHTVWLTTAPAGMGLPLFTEYGPWLISEVTKGLVGKADFSAVRPAGVGGGAAEMDGEAPLVIRRNRVLPKKNSLSLKIGPPKEPPYSFAVTRGTTGVVQTAPGALT